jgi:hypothetical protein
MRGNAFREIGAQIKYSQWTRRRIGKRGGLNSPTIVVGLDGRASAISPDLPYSSWRETAATLQPIGGPPEASTRGE